MDKWVPLGMDAESLEALTDGVPPWLHHSVWEWITDVLYSAPNDGKDLLQLYDRTTRRQEPVFPAFDMVGVPGLERAMSEADTLRLVDVMLGHARYANHSILDKLLLEGGSLWAVGERAGRLALARRVPEGVQIAAVETIQRSGSAGELLAEAWQACFGMDPDPEDAYEKAIKAVEEAGAAIVLPDNPKATLGTMLATMGHQDWRLPLEEATAHPSNDVARKMARALWSGQESRHGGNGYRKPTMEEAEAAVFLAVPLVQWFTSGVLARR